MTEEALQKNEASLIFKPFVLAALFICLLASIWFQLYIVIGILSFILVLGAFIFLWNKLATKDIDVTMDLPVSRVFASDTFDVQLTVKNDKTIPLVWLDVALNESPLVTWQDKPFYIVRFMWLLSYQDVPWHVQGKARHRGVYDVGQVTVKSGDGFRLMESEKQYNVHKKVYIYPRLVPIQIPAFTPAMQWEVRGDEGGVLEDPLMVSGVREYEPGDDVKQFNWWASARTGEMQTNVYERIVAKEMIIYVDVRGFVVHEKYSDEEKQQKYERHMKNAFESFLSMIASFAIAYHEQGVQVGFKTNALNDVGETQEMVRPKQEINSLLDELAQMTQRASANQWMMIGESDAPLYVFCKLLTEKHLALFEQVGQTRDVQFYYTIENTEAKKLHDVASKLDDLRAGDGE